MSVITEFTMFPTGKSESVSPYVARIIRHLELSGVSYQLTAMSTIFETATLGEAMKIISEAYSLLEPDCNRVFSTVKFDIRKGNPGRMEQKIASVESKTGILKK